MKDGLSHLSPRPGLAAVLLLADSSALPGPAITLTLENVNMKPRK